MIPIGRFIGKDSCLIPATGRGHTTPNIRLLFYHGPGTKIVPILKTLGRASFWGTKKMILFNFIVSLPKTEKTSK